MHHNRVALTCEGQQRIEFRSLSILAGRLISEHLVCYNMFKLPFWVLIVTAYPDIADTFTVQNTSMLESVRKKSITCLNMCQEIL